VERAALREVQRVGHVAGDRLEALLVRRCPVDARDRVHQAQRVGHLRVLEDAGDVGLLDGAAGVHDDDAVGHLGDDPEVVGDEQDRHADLVLQLAHEVEDLRLDGHVERGGRLVGDQQLGVARQRHRDHHALAHPARHLVRVVLDALGGLGDADQVEHLGRLLHRLAVALLLVEHDRLGDLVADGVHRVEAGHRLLEDHRDLVAADAAHLALALLDQVLALEEHLAAAMRPGGTGISRITERLVTDLPEPDSPTTPSVSPLSRWKLTPSTALTVPSSVSK
jgi:hypothetical protein